MPGTAGVDFEFDMMGAGDDHFPLCCKVFVQCNVVQCCFRRRVPGYDRSKLNDPACSAKFEALLQSCPLVPYAVEPSSHLFLINNFVYKAACDAFPKAGRVQRKKHLSHASFELVCSSADLRKRKAVLLTRLQNCTKYVLFRVWA
eukprot:5689176-Karenia_brevis.AAC.1